MSNEPELTVVGNVTGDPELRFTPSGAAVANFTVASTPRSFNKQTNEWVDGETLFMRCSVWRDAAENVAESLTKGTRVVVRGRLKQHSYTDKDGNNKTSIDLDVDEVGPSLRYATAKVTKTQRTQGQQGGQPQQDQWSGRPAQQQPAQQGQQGGWQAPPSDGPPPF
jgi:single-strand DNA-binding protein